MMKAELVKAIEEYAEVIKDRWADGYTVTDKTFESIALRHAELSGALQAAESIKEMIIDAEEEEID